MSLEALFTEPLRPDPNVAINPARISIPKPILGPVHGAQLVIEIAGPKTVLAPRAHELLGPRWNPALGRPEVYAMAPADRAWRLMSTSDGATSYDSVALAWDLLSPKGTLSGAAAAQLLATAASFAASVERRAFPFPNPSDVDRLVSGLQNAKEAFDVGVEWIVQGLRAIPERDIWIACSALGLDLAPDGSFVWRVADWDGPLLAVAPIEEGAVFSLRNVQSGLDHESISVGFNIPLSPDPAGCFEASVHIAQVLASRLSAIPYDSDGRALSTGIEQEARQNLASAVQALTSSGLAPGSPASRKLFGEER